MTRQRKLGKCRKCLLLSTALGIASLALLAASVLGSFALHGILFTPLFSVGLGFFGVLSAMHLIARFSAKRSREAAFRRLRKEAEAAHFGSG